MQVSSLSKIIQRLEVMTYSGQFEQRRFEIDGIELAIVSYDPYEDVYELHDLRRNSRYYFDVIDLVAIEVYELLG